MQIIKITSRRNKKSPLRIRSRDLQLNRDFTRGLETQYIDSKKMFIEHWTFLSQKFNYSALAPSHYSSTTTAQHPSPS